MLHYAKNQKLELTEQNKIAERKLRLERRMGEILQEMPLQHGARGTGHNQYEVRSQDETTPTYKKLADLGITKSDSSRWQMIARLPEELFEQYIADVKDRHKELTTAGVYEFAKRWVKEHEREELQPPRSE